MVIDKTNNLVELFNIRERTITETTNTIFAAMPEALEAINELSGLNDIENIGGLIIWDDISLVNEVDPAMIIMVGYIKFPPGCELTTSAGDKVKVTEDTEPYFRRLVRASFPLTLATQPKHEVITYFKKMQEDAEYQDEIDDLDRLFAPPIINEFDLSLLNEEQRHAYELSSIKPGKA